ncbi:MAG: hypothetical protein HYX69_07060 [Planctomycetia bacterium]|nr:hypothetical protein [Planctomycetia bacterium]
MKPSTHNVLAIFRRYKVRPDQMLFIHNLDDRRQSAMTQLINDGLVIRERRRNAYSLTAEGYAAVQSL